MQEFEVQRRKNGFASFAQVNLFKMNSILAIDAGGTRIKWGVIEDGQVVRFGIEAAVRGDASSQQQQLQRIHSSHGRDLPLAIAWPGELNTGCKTEDLRDQLERSSLPVLLVTDDMIAAALGEARGRDIALMQIGTGVGGALVRDGKAFKAITGHIVFREHGIPCSSGMRGTVDAYLGWSGIRRRMAGLEITQMPETPADFLQLARQEDSLEYLLEDALAAAGFAASYLVACSAGKTLVISGGVAAAWGEKLRAAVEEELSWRLFPAFARQINVELSVEREIAPLKGLWQLSQDSDLDGTESIAE